MRSIRNRRVRFLIALAFVPVVLLSTALGYMTLMATFEGDPRTFVQSLEWATETLTTTGYGRDSEWSHPALVAYVIVVQLAGLFAVFSLFPLFLLPFLESRFESRIPTELPRLSGSLVVYGFGPSVASLLVEANARGVSTLVVEPDEHQARVALEEGHRVVHLRFTEATHDVARLASAAAIVANAGDDEDAALLFEARDAGFSGPLIALVDTPSHREAMVLAGATLAFTSREAQAAELAAHTSKRLRPQIIGVEHLSRQSTLVEMRVSRASELLGLSVGEANVRRKTGATLLALFDRGQLVPVTAATKLSAKTRVLAVGSSQALQALGRLLLPMSPSGGTLVVGDGVVARRTREVLRGAGETVRWLASDPEAEFTGDPLDPTFMASVGLARYAYVVLALENDARTLLALAVLRSIASDVRVVAGVDRRENEDRTLRAGADVCESLAAIAGRVLLFHVTGEDPRTEHEPTIEVITPTLKRAVSVSEVQLPAGVMVVAVRRGPGEEEVDVDARTTINPGDSLVVCRPPQR